MNFLRFQAVVLLATTIIFLSASAVQGKGTPRSSQATIAVEFLRRLESGQAETAHAMLERQVAQMYPPDKLAPAVAGSKLPMAREIRSERAIESTEAYANRINPKFANRATRPAYVVCLADVPQSGYGRLRYITVILVADPSTDDWKVSDYRYQSEPDHLCRG